MLVRKWFIDLSQIVSVSVSAALCILHPYLSIRNSICGLFTIITPNEPVPRVNMNYTNTYRYIFFFYTYKYSYFYASHDRSIE